MFMFYAENSSSNSSSGIYYYFQKLLIVVVEMYHCHFLNTLISKALYFIKMCPFFVGSLYIQDEVQVVSISYQYIAMVRYLKFKTLTDTIRYSQVVRLSSFQLCTAKLNFSMSLVSMQELILYSLALVIDRNVKRQIRLHKIFYRLTLTCHSCVTNIGRC